jgi:uncharacterized membrane protein
MKDQRLTSQWIKVLVALVIALGILFRFIDLDQKPYWHDETHTSLHISGYSAQAAIQHLFTGQVIRAADILQFQYPSAENTVLDTIHGLATENAQHPPLYYVIARFWADRFGASEAMMRTLPALISLVAFPGIYWLALELFASPALGWMSMSLLAVSPVSIRYAQEARQYSLWIVITLLSSAMLLRAMRSKRIWPWLMYLFLLIAGLYCHILFCLTILGHGLYVFLLACFWLDQIVIRYLLTSSLAILAFAPWLWTMQLHRETVLTSTAWTQQPVSLFELLKSWGIHICQIFTAWHFRYDERLVYLAIPILILLGFAIKTLCQQTSKRAWLFIVILMGISILPIVFPDLIWGGKRSTNVRYFLPCYMGFYLSIAYLLTDQLTKTLTSAMHQRRWQTITAVLMTGSILTCVITSQSNTWWGWSEFDVEISRRINHAAQPLLISDVSLGAIMPLSHRLHPETKLLLTTSPETLVVPTQPGEVFVYNPSDRLKASLAQQNLTSKIIYQFRDDTLILTLYRLFNA